MRTHPLPFLRVPGWVVARQARLLGVCERRTAARPLSTSWESTPGPSVNGQAIFLLARTPWLRQSRQTVIKQRLPAFRGPSSPREAGRVGYESAAPAGRVQG